MEFSKIKTSFCLGRLIAGIQILALLVLPASFILAAAADSEVTGEESTEAKISDGDSKKNKGDSGGDSEEKKRKEIDQKKKKDIEEKVDDLEEEIEKIEDRRQKDVKVKWQISSEIGAIDSNISEVERDLQATANEVERAEMEIKRSDLAIEEKKKLMAEAIRELDRIRLETNFILLGDKYGLKKYFFASDSLGKLEEGILEMIDELKEKKEEKESRKQEYAEVMEVHNDQKSTLQSEKNKKSYLLNQTQAKINKKDADIANLQAKLSKLQSDLSSLLGKSYNFSDIEKAVKFASEKTGVRKDFLMGMLVVESDLGRFTGGCNYKESRMNAHREKLFKKICKDLGYDYKKKKVSCPPKNYRGTGGAMGVEQFMSDTWVAYESQIAAKTGNNPPDPWSLTDGVMAMALKLARDGGTKRSGECAASKRYLGGSHQWYCDKVQYWAKHYEKKL